MPNQKKKKSSGRSNKPSQVSSTLKRIEQYEKTQTRGRLPTVPDITKMLVPHEKIMTFQRSYTGPNVTPSTTIDQAGAFQFALSSLPDSAEFTALFDQYRIIQATVTFVPTSTVSSSTSLFTVLDYDDAVTPTSINQMMEYQTLQISETGTFIERTLTPRPSLAAYSGAFTSFTSANSRTWIDSTSPGVLYYGLKWYNIAQAGNNTGINWTSFVQLTVQCKFVR